MFREAGLPHTERIERVPNTMKAQRLTEWAREQGRHRELHDRLFDAYWARGLDIGTDDVLLDEAEAAGLDREAAAEVLASDRYADVVAAETERAVELGAGGVPAWVVDGRVLVPGAQPHDVFERVLAKLDYE